MIPASRFERHASKGFSNGVIAEIGSVVRYSDMANVGSTYVILELPKFDATYGWLSGYTLRATEAPFTVTTSDLRQHGWKIFNDQTETWERVDA